MRKYSDMFKILKCEYAGVSTYGNPKKRLVLERVDTGEIEIATTATNAVCGYMGYSQGGLFLMAYHYTRTSGAMIIDSAQEL